jgi:hypothetical protein
MPKRYVAPVTGVNTAAVITLPKPEKGAMWTIDNITASYNVAPAAAQEITIVDGTIAEGCWITAAGPAPIEIRGTYTMDAAVTITLPAAAGCTGRLACSASFGY